MAEAPEVEPHDVIRIGIHRAVVCQVSSSGYVEVVYLDDRERAINDDAIWDSDKWRFKNSGPTGGYSGKYDRLSTFVTQLCNS
jgi:hypothetical protein